MGSTNNSWWYIVFPRIISRQVTGTMPLSNTGWGSEAVTLPNIPRYGRECTVTSFTSLRRQYGRPSSALGGMLVYDGILMTSDDSMINYHPWWWHDGFTQPHLRHNYVRLIVVDDLNFQNEVMSILQLRHLTSSTLHRTKPVHFPHPWW